jgi:hypothetical protein
MSMTEVITNVAGFKVATKITQANFIDYLIAFEGGELDDIDTVLFFQYLIDTGQAWSLQGFYGRTAKSLIEQGYCFRADDLNRPGIVDASVDVPALESGD